tara:strand:- start:1631 stop:2095 length:465 start_codon:yes stop_codon:yes gene_type:complete
MHFRGQYDFLSNFYPATVKDYPTVENAYQAAKCSDINDRESFKHCTPGQAKRMGRRVKCIPNWNDKRIYVMYKALQLKFANPVLRDRLLAVSDEGEEKLIEENTWHDNFWGVCTCNTEKCHGANWQNWLGNLLTAVRCEHLGITHKYSFDPTHK